MFNIGDLIYYVTSNVVHYGVCTGLNYTGETLVSYNVKAVEAPHATTVVLVANARASAYALVSPTPSSTPYPTGTPHPSVSPSMTVSPTPVIPANLFPATTSGWTLVGGTLAVNGNKTVFTTTGGLATFSKTFTVVANKYYNFSFNYGEGTARVAKMTVDAHSGQTFAVSVNGDSDSGAVVTRLLQDSGSFNQTLFITGTTSVTVTYQVFNDASLGNPAAGFTYGLSATNLTPVVINVSLSASLSATPTPSPTLTVSGSNFATPTPTISLSVGVVSPTPSATATHTPTVTPTHSVVTTVTPSPTPTTSAGSPVTPSPTATVTTTVTPTPSRSH